MSDAGLKEERGGRSGSMGALEAFDAGSNGPIYLLLTGTPSYDEL